MADRYNYNVVPRADRDAHEYNGHDCPCEPRVLLASDAYRIIVHSSDTDVLKLRQIPGDEPSLPPGDTE